MQFYFVGNTHWLKMCKYSEKKIMHTILSDPAFANTAVTGKENIWLLLFNYF